MNNHERLEHEAKIWDKAEKKLSPDKPKWRIIDSDTGIIFAKKEMPNCTRHMDILEDKANNSHSIIIYETGKEDNNVMVRNTNARKKR